MKLDVGNIPVMSRLFEKVSKRPVWYKPEQDQLDKYTETLYSKLIALQVPDSLQCLDPQCKDEEHSRERDNYMLNILSAIIETSHTVIPLSGGRKTKA